MPTEPFQNILKKRIALLSIGFIVLALIGYEGWYHYNANLAAQHVTITGGMILPQNLEVASATKPSVCLVSATCEMTKQGMGLQDVSTLKQKYSLYVDEKGKLLAMLMGGNVQQGGSYFYTATMLVVTAMEKNTYKLTYYGVVNTNKIVGSWNHPIVYDANLNESLPWTNATSWSAKKLDMITLTAGRGGSIRINSK